MKALVNKRSDFASLLLFCSRIVFNPTTTTTTTTTQPPPPLVVWDRAKRKMYEEKLLLAAPASLLSFNESKVPSGRLERIFGFASTISSHLTIIKISLLSRSHYYHDLTLIKITFIKISLLLRSHYYHDHIYYNHSYYNHY
jgi:hypothetical protein